MNFSLNISSIKNIEYFFNKTFPSGEPYSTPTAIYSLRLVNKEWFARSVINVRRSDNVEKEFTALDIESGTMGDWITSGGLVARDAFVTTWYDQSGNGHHASQSADASQPKIWDSSTGLVTEGGRPAIEFDGSDDYLTILNSASDGSNPLSINGDIFCSIILTPTEVRSAYWLNNYQGASAPYTGQHILWHQDPAGADVTFETSYDDNSTPSTLVSTSQSLGQYIVTNVRNDGGTNYLYINGAQNVSGADTATGDILSDQDWVIGARAEDATAEIWKGQMQEIILYDSDQSANRTAIENNINAYYVVYGVLHYRQRVAADSGTFAIEDRDQTVYNSVTIPEMPSLICSCDAYKATKLYNINPA